MTWTSSRSRRGTRSRPTAAEHLPILHSYSTSPRVRGLLHYTASRDRRLLHYTASRRPTPTSLYGISRSTPTSLYGVQTIDAYYTIRRPDDRRLLPILNTYRTPTEPLGWEYPERCRLRYANPLSRPHRRGLATRADGGTRGVCGRTDEPNGFGRHIPRRRERSEETCRA